MMPGVDERIDNVLDAWNEERELRATAERRLIVLEAAAFRVLAALFATSFAPTPDLEVAILELRELVGD
jgi:hypothetical protein